MSAYGTVLPEVKRAPLQSRLYVIPPRDDAPSERAAILFVPYSSAAMRERCTIASEGDGGEVMDEVPAELEALLRREFNAELALGITYPQRGPMNDDEFRTYFLGYDLIIGLFLTSSELAQLSAHSEPSPNGQALSASAVPALLPAATSPDAGNWWVSRLAAAYYIKPNYPGRSSHLCNAGFLVPAASRGTGAGSLAGRSFLHYGPAAGYKGSVFNLVYEDNVASLRIWERLGFHKVGKVPGAGRRKAAQLGERDVYVDAWVVYGDFEKLGVP